MDSPAIDMDEVVALRKALREWRAWAQFVWLGGGPVELLDEELRRRICEVADVAVVTATPERQAFVRKQLGEMAVSVVD